MEKCDCKKCSDADDLAREQAFNLYYEQGELEIEYQSWNYECGDGCCSDYGTRLIVNGYIIAEYAESNGGVFELLQLLRIPNTIQYTEASNE
jgi:hypothetical protein